MGWVVDGRYPLSSNINMEVRCKYDNLESSLVCHSLSTTMLLLVCPLAAVALLMGSAARAELTVYTGPAPNLPANRSTFSFGSLATGGSATNSSSIFLVDNMPDLRTALTLPYPRIVYVKGNITGHQITSDAANGSTYADCQWFTDNSGAKQFNLTRYVMSLNTSYMDGVKLAADSNGTIEGMNAVEYLALLKKMNVGTLSYFVLVHWRRESGPES